MEPRAGGDAGQGSQSVRRTLDLLSLVASWEHRGGLTVGQLADESGLTKPTVHRMLGELVRADYLEQAHDRRYRLGPEAYSVGRAAEARHGLPAAAVASVVRLARVTEDVAFVSVRRRNHTLCLLREEGSWPVRSHVLQAGDRHPLGVGAHGIALLAALAPETAASLLAAGSEEIGATYPQIDVAVLASAVDAARINRGVAVNEGLVVRDSWGIGVAVPDGTAEPTFALSVAAVSSRLGQTRQNHIAALLLEESHRLGTALRARSGSTSHHRPG